MLEGLLSEGYSVIALHRRNSTESLRQHERLTWIAWAEVEACFDQRCPNAVIHLATCYGTDASLGDIVASNIFMPLRLLELAKAKGSTLFINTDSFYAKSEYDYSHMRPYIQSKRDFARWAFLAAEGDTTFKVVNARLEHVYGPGDDTKKFIPYMLDKLAVHETLALTPGEQLRDFVHVEDVVSAYLTILKAGPHLPPDLAEVQVGTGRAHSVRELVETARHLSASRSRLDFTAYPYRDQEIMCSVADNATLMQLGWTPVFNLSAGLKKTIGLEF